MILGHGWKVTSLAFAEAFAPAKVSLIGKRSVRLMEEALLKSHIAPVMASITFPITIAQREG